MGTQLQCQCQKLFRTPSGLHYHTTWTGHRSAAAPTGRVRVTAALRQRRIEALKDILGRYKRPMHRDYVAKFAKEEFGTLFDRPRVVTGLLVGNPVQFRCVSEGTYELVK